MKIVKQFDDPVYFHRCFRRFPAKDEYYRWGLGDDGLVYYCDSMDRGYPLGFWSKIVRPGQTITMRDMKLLIKEFGHLLVWI